MLNNMDNMDNMLYNMLDNMSNNMDNMDNMLNNMLLALPGMQSIASEQADGDVRIGVNSDINISICTTNPEIWDIT